MKRKANDAAHKVLWLTSRAVFSAALAMSKMLVIFDVNSWEDLIGADIFVFNHTSRIETVILPWKLSAITGNKVVALVDKRFRVGALGWYLKTLGFIFTDDADKYEKMVNYILGGGKLIIFPQGKIVKSGEYERTKTGAARVAVLTANVDRSISIVPGRVSIEPIPESFEAGLVEWGLLKTVSSMTVVLKEKIVVDYLSLIHDVVKQYEKAILED